ncbi:hypothetical protein DdX_10046 [Ditylenchus destructor]|uniref:Uncharacterized protein n=1 Tax=Ditylenchus destructor TaxID=166010 RepID=A0AAD4R5V5_9BILA|nr:hypothetical protein DdX_10046 [Ditylenchus destructor]
MKISAFSSQESQPFCWPILQTGVVFYWVIQNKSRHGSYEIRSPTSALSTIITNLIQDPKYGWLLIFSLFVRDTLQKDHPDL